MQAGIRFFAAGALALLAGAAGAADENWGRDAPGGQDPAPIRRFTGSWQIGYRAPQWDQTVFPTGPAVDTRGHKEWLNTVGVEGEVTRAFFLAPRGKSPLEVHRSYEQALAAAGLKAVFRCELKCDDLYFGMDETLHLAKGTAWAKGSLGTTQGDSRYSIDHGALSAYEGRFLYGTLPAAGGAPLHVLVYTSLAENELTGVAATFIQTARPKAMQAGQVVVDAQALQQGLQAEGKVALYGIYFDTGKAVLKPESQPQLAQMAKALQSQPQLKVFIVGHTDNQGGLDGNLALSMQRAQAVAQALAAQHKVDPKRLLAKGVANLAPVASNAGEEGRSRNRRVEMVVQ